MDYAIYVSARHIYGDKDFAKWEIDHRELERDLDGDDRWMGIITTPKMQLQNATAESVSLEGCT